MDGVIEPKGSKGKVGVKCMASLIPIGKMTTDQFQTFFTYIEFNRTGYIIKCVYHQRAIRDRGVIRDMLNIDISLNQ